MSPARKSYSAPPAMTIDKKKKYTATMETNKGTLTLQLFAADVPNTVNNFVFLAREGFYDNTVFHRVIEDFMVQGGDPTGTGRGGPGYQFSDEFTAHTHVTGALSMANAGPGTNGSQFFICHCPQPHLNHHHSVFGQLTGGQDAFYKIVQGDKLLKVTITEE
jgi:peptidyl-prolyl cis-trans isomerase B (cyclophilin B)